jgi:uncharacterized protein YdbL (DUF1318 family)
MSFESERIAAERAGRINTRVAKNLNALDRKATTADIIQAINAAHAAEDPDDGELTYEMDE